MGRETTKSILERLAQIEWELSEVPDLYRERDQLIAALVERKFKSRKSGEKNFLLLDNFAEKQTAFKTVAFPRYRVEIF